MHHSSDMGHEECVKELVERGAETTAECNEGRIPLQYAAAHGHVQVVHYLLGKALHHQALLGDKKVFSVSLFSSSYH